MKRLTKLIALCGLIALGSACTFGDKGSEKVPDSLRIDTTQTSNPEGGYTGTGVTTDTAVNTGRGTIIKDTTKTDSTPKSKMP